MHRGTLPLGQIITHIAVFGPQYDPYCLKYEYYQVMELAEPCFKSSMLRLEHSYDGLTSRQGRSLTPEADLRDWNTPGENLL